MLSIFLSLSSLAIIERQEFFLNLPIRWARTTVLLSGLTAFWYSLVISLWDVSHDSSGAEWLHQKTMRLTYESGSQVRKYYIFTRYFHVKLEGLTDEMPSSLLRKCTLKNEAAFLSRQRRYYLMTLMKESVRPHNWAKKWKFNILIADRFSYENFAFSIIPPVIQQVISFC